VALPALQEADDCQTLTATDLHPGGRVMARKFRLAHTKSPGDITVMTALVRDLVRTYPDVQVDVHTTCKDIWRHNPYLTKLGEGPDVRTLTLDYSAGIKRQGQETIHFLGEFHHNFFKQTRIKVPLTEPKPDLHLIEEEKTTRIVAGRYWVIVAGGKSDATVKIWDYRSWQRTIDMLAEQGIQTVQLGALDSGHWHAQLTGTLNLVGKTNLRDMLRIIYQAEGAICGVTFAMHAAAGLEKPCVVIAGGREHWPWEAYVRENRGLVCPEKIRVPHRYLHTIGLLSCCERVGCWRNKVLPLNGDKLICHLPVIRPGQAVPKCMDLVTPDMTVSAVLSYYLDGTLPPIGSYEEMLKVQCRHRPTERRY
jgi:ADP-heptose:LPS heptosyltransferase